MVYHQADGIVLVSDVNCDVIHPDLIATQMQNPDRNKGWKEKKLPIDKGHFRNNTVTCVFPTH